jgi:hypothetical protein
MVRCPGDGFVEFVGLVGFVGFVALHAGPWLLGDLRCRVAWELLSASGTATPGPGTQWAQRTLETLRTRRASSHELRWVRGEGARVGRRSAVHGYSAIFVAESLGSCFQRVISQLLERAARRSLLPSHCSVALGVKKRVLMRSFMKAHTLLCEGAQARIFTKQRTALGPKKRVLMRSVLTKERTTICVRGGSTVLVVKPLGRSRGEWRLLLTRLLSRLSGTRTRWTSETAWRRRQATSDSWHSRTTAERPRCDSSTGRAMCTARYAPARSLLAHSTTCRACVRATSYSSRVTGSAGLG